MRFLPLSVANWSTSLNRLFLRSRTYHRYSPVESSYSDPPTLLEARQNGNKPRQQQQQQQPLGSKISISISTLILLSALATLVVASSAFYAGSTFSSSSPPFAATSAPIKHLFPPAHPITFKYNGAYAAAPSNKTNASWRTLLPSHGGFFKPQPQEGYAQYPQDSTITFAVFHQLHCLDAMRHGYALAWDYATSSSSLKEEDVSIHESPVHMRHCLDLLRQSLMCQPDFTVEVVDEAKGGVTGFGTEHVCVDWWGLVEWVEERSDGVGEGGHEGHEHGHGHGHDGHTPMDMHDNE